ncbi:hypothetical protein BDQ17DRAFT_1398729 [Cyathus striatus]|nr:hypothetical protein BDQ17DRAFT_1398729 [Cyathus striatus]
MSASRLLVDVHTHVYLPRYASLLRSRSSVPFIRSNTRPDGTSDERLLILDHEPSGGRPVGSQYWDREEKLKFMDKHGIDVSVVSTANPWLDFLPASQAQTLASKLNHDLEEYCSTGPTVSVSSNSIKRLYDIPSAHLRGLIMGTRGVGNGLDDEALDPVWEAIEKAGLVVFLHPHYGKNNGFPFETTIAATRLILSGVFDRFPGALPALSSRLASCIDHDPVVASRLKHDARYYLGKLYLDAVSYGPEELGFTKRYESHSNVSPPPDRSLGSKRMLFGTDHPFFPPLKDTDKWKSVVENLEAIDAVQGWSQADKDGVKGGNAVELFNLK